MNLKKPEANSDKPEADHYSRNVIVIGIALIVILVVLGIAARLQMQHALQRNIDETAAIVVATIAPTASDAEQTIVLPGNVEAFADAPLYARATGYLKNWTADIGTRVKKGQLLAELDIPEVDQQLLQAQAELANAVANQRLAQSTAQRWQELLAADSISKQEADEKISDAVAKNAQLDSARANVERLRQLQSFKRIEAPFDGVVTARNVDIGALVNAGSGQELFRIVASKKLRVYVRAPQIYAPLVRPGLNASLELAEHPGLRYAGTLVRTADAIDPVTRTLLLQVEVDNARGELLPGSYARVHLKLPGQRNLLLPVNTLIFRADGLQVATVNGEQRVVLKPIVLGRDFGSEVEVVSGIGPNDAVILNPPDALVGNQRVRLAKTESKTAAKE
jgi:RND family efflux transporter MFP subunit